METDIEISLKKLIINFIDTNKLNECETPEQLQEKLLPLKNMFNPEKWNCAVIQNEISKIEVKPKIELKPKIEPKPKIELKPNDALLNLIKQNGELFQCISKEFQTAELCTSVIKDNYNNFQYIPKELQTVELCLVAFQQNHDSLKYITTVGNIVLSGTRYTFGQNSVLIDFV